MDVRALMQRLLSRRPGRPAPLRGPAIVAALRRRKAPVLLGSLGSTAPVSANFGYDRGKPVDRWYIERFLAAHRADITGRVIEVKDSLYTDRFGHDLTERAVLDIDPDNPNATHIADLAVGEGLPDAAFDCFVITQTLQLVYDLRGALAQAHRILRPGGVLLATVPVTSRVCDPPLTDHWRFTPLSVARLLEEAFGPGAATVEGRGNVLTQVAFLEGLAAEDLTPDELATDDERFPLLVCARRAGGLTALARSLGDRLRRVPRIVRRAPGRPAAVALTFDDGPSPWTPQIAAALERHGCRGTFFLLGEAVQREPEAVAALRRAGHELGNHLWSHADPARLSHAQLRAEIERTAAAIGAAAGAAPPDLVRPPYCGAPHAVARAVGRDGARLVVLRSVDPEDWNTDRSGEIVERVLAKVGPGDIVCLHDGVSPNNTGTDSRGATAAAVAQLVPALLERGLRPVTVSELLA